jgi:methionyl-tRNA synthetase
MLRYFLLRSAVRFGRNFSWERFEERYNADLANALGNLASRTTSMVERYYDDVVPAVSLRVDEADLGIPTPTAIRSGPKDSCCTRPSRPSA